MLAPLMQRRLPLAVRSHALLSAPRNAAFSSQSSVHVMEAAKIALHQVPLVDISPLVHQREQSGHAPATTQQKAKILEDMKRACLDTGFFTVPTKNVLSNDLITKVYTRADEFIALPDAVKQQYHNKKTPNSRGWTPMFEEPSYQPDVVSHLEGFDLARELPESFIQPGSSLGPNVWPRELPHFREDVYQLYEETTVVSQVLFQSFAEMLGLPANTFLQHVSEKAEAFMRLLTYPEVEAKVKNSTVGIASHTDFECFTIIHQNGAGLHLKNRNGNWVEAPVHEDRLFIMVGDVLEHWTNGLLQATEHRVVNSEKKRQSIVRFNGADGDTIIEPLAPFVTATHPAKYGRTTQREHIAEQIRIAEEQLQETKAAKALV
uniref:Fe2OG dioxygenase domain-containing protein n=1 Tax=Globisporangium ultimum (strain ATCC 200006 / CBS 805.95 / DAOM BR144) TaxID=431595 RepID=K3WG17_GLOUD